MKKTIVVIACAAIVVAGGMAARGTRADSGDPRPAPPITPASAAAARDADIALFERRAQEDPWSAYDRARLAGLYLRRARETGGYSDIERATVEARRSLKLGEGRNESAYRLLVSALLAQHDFVGALEAARSLVEEWPEVTVHHAILGEVLLELGRYEEAARAFAVVEADTATLSTAPRLVRWYELTGHLDRARAMARRTIQLANAGGDLSGEQLAWFHLRAGEIEAKGGAGAVADSLFDLGLATFPDDYRLLAAKARLTAARGDWKGAIALGERAIAVQLEPGTLGLLRDAWESLGDTAQSASYARAMTTSALSQPGAIHRAWGLHLVDHREEVSEVLSRVREELRSRRDVYGYDLEAWALHALGRDGEAWQSMQRALSQGTEDPQLWYHAGVIAAALGRSEEARDFLVRALEQNPAFHYSAAKKAKELLARLSYPAN